MAPAPGSVATGLAAFGPSFRPRGRRTRIPDQRRYRATVSRRTPVASSMRRSDQPRFTLELVTEVHERMRRLVGQWKATPYGSTMELSWSAPAK